MPTVIDLDELDSAIRDRRVASWDERPGPRVGDFVRFADGVLRRFSHDWDEHGLQTSDGSDQSFYLGEGYMNFSGSLHPAVPRESLYDTGEIRDGACWFFHHDMRRAHNATRLVVPCRVFACNLPAHPSETRDA